jgi:hypothetical protein
LVRRSLGADGVLAVWSADRCKKFEAALTESGFAWRAVEMSVRDDDGPSHTVYLARRDAGL